MRRVENSGQVFDPWRPSGRATTARFGSPSSIFGLFELAHDIALRGILQPIVVRPAADAGRYRVLFDAKRRTLHELAKLQKTRPERVKAIVTGKGEITRNAVASLANAPRPPPGTPRKVVSSRRASSLAAQAGGLCARLEALIDRMTKPGAPVTPEELATLRRRLAELAAK